MITVFMRSEEYGYEEYEYETLHEALDAITRLRQKALDLNDGIEREIGLKTN